MISHTEPCDQLRVDLVDLEELASLVAGNGAEERPPLQEGRLLWCCLSRCLSSASDLPTEALPERHLGEVWVRGEGVTDGYVNTSSEGLIVGDWLRVGDLGYMAEGELFVTGRSNEVIVRLGQKYHPEDIEQAVQRAVRHPPGSCVAFSPLEGHQGDLVVVVEDGR